MYKVTTITPSNDIIFLDFFGSLSQAKRVAASRATGALISTVDDLSKPTLKGFVAKFTGAFVEKCKSGMR